MVQHPSRPGLTAVTDQTLASVIRDERRPVVVDFWAPGCPPCVMISRTLVDLADEFGDDVAFTEINADENLRSTMEYRVMATPTVLLFHRGVVVDTFVGARSKSAVRELLRRHLDRAADAQ